MTKEEAKKILTEYVKACHEDDWLTLEQFVYEEVIEAMSMGAEALSEYPISSNLEEAAKEYAYDGDIDGYGVTYAESNGKYFRTEVMNHFIAGAEWQKEQYHFFNEAWADNMQYHLDRNYENGKQDMREQMMKDAVEGTMYEQPDGTTFLDCQASFPKEMFNHGEKVKVIIVKEK